MPVGHPKDPVAHEAVLAANRAKKAARKVQSPTPKRKYKPRKAVAKKTADTKHFLNYKLSEVAISVEPDKVVKDLEAKLDSLTWENELLKKRSEDAERRLMSVLDLVSNVELRVH